MAIQIITTNLPNGTVGTAYSQTVQSVGGQAPLVFSVSAGTLPAGLSLNTSTGNISGTPSAASNYNFTIEVTDNNSLTDTQDFTVRTFAALNTSPDPISPATRVVMEAGNQVAFSATGGSGNFQWSVNGGNLINPNTGLLTAINGGEYTVTLTDLTSGQVAIVPITITSQSQFCVQGSPVDDDISISGDACCEFNVECGDKLQLAIASFHINENGQKKAIVYSNLVQVTTGDAAKLLSKANGAGASGNEVSFNRDVYFEIITNADMADTANNEFAIGWSSVDVDTTIDSIDHAVVWFTDTDRFVEIRHGGAAEADSQFAIAEGDAVSFGVINGVGTLFINSIKVFESGEDFSACNTVVLDISISDSGKTIGGNVQGLDWTISTTGTASEVGTIDADGVYTSPTTPIAGIIKVVGTVGTASFTVNVRNIQPTPKFTKPQPFLAGRRAHVWVTDKRASDTDVIRIASDGSPDALQNPGMIYLGVLEGSAKFAEEITYQNFDNDEGTYFTGISAEKAALTGTFLEVRDLDKLALLMQHSTLHPANKGVRELSVGGKTCGGCDLRAVLVVEAGSCGSGWDVLYLPRVQNNANLVMEIGHKANAKYDLNFMVLPDTTRPAGRQLYSIYQLDNCSSVESGASCG
jgi:hypothetical protein